MRSGRVVLEFMLYHWFIMMGSLMKGYLTA